MYHGTDGKLHMDFLYLLQVRSLHNKELIRVVGGEVEHVTSLSFSTFDVPDSIEGKEEQSHTTTL